jgi:hypothetical protein
MIEDPNLENWYSIRKTRPVILGPQIESKPESILRVSEDAYTGAIHGFDYGWGETWLQECWLLPDKMDLKAASNSIMKCDTVTKFMGTATYPWAYSTDSIENESLIEYKYVRPGKNFPDNLIRRELGTWQPNSGGWNLDKNQGGFLIDMKSIANWLNDNYSGSRSIARIVLDFLGFNNKSHLDQEVSGNFGILEAKTIDQQIYPRALCGTPETYGINLGSWVDTNPDDVYGNMLSLHLTLSDFNFRDTSIRGANSALYYFMPIAYDREDVYGSRLPQRPCMRISIVVCSS